MADIHASAEPTADSPPWARRFLRIFALVVGCTALIVAAINLLVFSLITRPEYAAIVQMGDGWGRTYKPILHDILKPRIAIFGASWTRDAFDADEITKLLGKSAFNHAVSGGLPYENRRFLQSALAANPDLDTVILNLNSLLLRPGAVRFNYGFDEALLNVNAKGEPNDFVGARRAYAVTLSGAAIGLNIDLLYRIARLANGETKQDVVSSYQRRDFEGGKPGAPPTGADVPTPAIIDDAVAHAGETGDIRYMAEFQAALDLVCARNLSVYFYLTPNLADGWGSGSMPLAKKFAVLNVLKARAFTCKAHLAFYDFDYPNAVTLEYTTNPGLSLYYRPDGHPRPTVGMLMAARMFGAAWPAGSESVQADFGIDLMTAPDPIGWLKTRAEAQVAVWAKD